MMVDRNSVTGTGKYVNKSNKNWQSEELKESTRLIFDISE